MAVTIDGTNGITSPDFEPSSSTTPTNGLFLPTTNALGFATNSAERLRLDASGNLQLGTTTNPDSRRLRVYGISEFDGSGVGLTIFKSSGTKIGSAGQGDYIVSGGPSDGFGIQSQTSLVFGSGGTSERARIDSSGNLLVGTTSALASEGFTVVRSTGANPVGAIRNGNATAGKYWIFGPNSSNNYILYNNGGAGVYVADGGTSWTSSSDERFKTDLKPIDNAVKKVSTLRAVTGRFKADKEGMSRAFLIAQDVLAVLPEAVDASDPDKLGVQYTDIIPLLVAAIKELTARLEALENK